MRAVSRIDTLQAGSAFRTWLFRIAHNLSIDWRRRDGRIQTSPLPDEDVTTLPSAVEGPLERVQADEERANVASALAELKDNYREALVLHQVEGQRVADVAEHLNLTHGATEVLLFRARRRLREAYRRRDMGVSGVALLAGLRQLTAHLAAPLLSGAGAPAAGVVAVVTIGAAVVGIPHIERGNISAAHRPVLIHSHPIAHSHTPPVWPPKVARRTVALRMRGAGSVAARKPVPGPLVVRHAGSGRSRTLRTHAVTSHSTHILARPGGRHQNRIAPAAWTSVRASIPSGRSPTAPVFRSRIANTRSGSGTVSIAPSVARRPGRSTFVPSSTNGKGSRAGVLAPPVHGESNHPVPSKEGAGRSHGHVDRSPGRDGPAPPGTAFHSRSGEAKRHDSSSSRAPGAPPSAVTDHGRSGHTQRGKSEGRTAPLTSATAAPAGPTTSAPSRGRSDGPEKKTSTLPTAAPTPAPAASPSSPPSGAPPGQSNRSGSHGHAPVPATPVAPAAPVPSVSASAVPAGSSGASGCPPAARGKGCDNKP